MFKISSSLSRRVPLQRSTIYPRKLSTTASGQTTHLLSAFGFKRNVQVTLNHVLVANYSGIKPPSKNPSNASDASVKTSTLAQLLEVERSQALEAHPDLRDPDAQNKVLLEFKNAIGPFYAKAESDKDMTSEEIIAFGALQNKAFAAQALQDSSGDIEAHEARQKVKGSWSEMVQKINAIPSEVNSPELSFSDDMASKYEAADLPKLLETERKEVLIDYPYLSNPSTHARIIEEAETALKAMKAKPNTRLSYRQFERSITLQLKRLAVKALRDDSGDINVFENRQKARRLGVKELERNTKNRRQWWMQMLGINLVLNAVL